MKTNFNLLPMILFERFQHSYDATQIVYQTFDVRTASRSFAKAKFVNVDYFIVLEHRGQHARIFITRTEPVDTEYFNGDILVSINAGFQVRGLMNQQYWAEFEESLNSMTKVLNLDVLPRIASFKIRVISMVLSAYADEIESRELDYGNFVHLPEDYPPLPKLVPATV